MYFPGIDSVPPTQSNPGYCRRRRLSPNLATIAADSVQSWLPPLPTLSNPGCCRGRLCPILAAAAAHFFQSWLPPPSTLSIPCCRRRRLCSGIACGDGGYKMTDSTPFLLTVSCTGGFLLASENEGGALWPDTFTGDPQENLRGVHLNHRGYKIAVAFELCQKCIG